MSKVYIGIGSNLGDRQLNIDKALEKLKSKKNIQLGEISSVIETSPVGGVKQPDFLNACCRIDTTLYPDEILTALKSIEREMGRGRDSIPKKLSVEEQLKALEEGRPIERPSADKQAIKKKSASDQIWGPRIIDLDILLYDDIIMKGNNLIVPHRLLHERVFVLEPLSQIAPDLIHPVFKKSIKDLLLERRSYISIDNNKQKLLTKESNDVTRVPVLAQLHHDSPKTFLGLICKLLRISHPKLSKIDTINEAH